MGARSAVRSEGKDWACGPLEAAISWMRNSAGRATLSDVARLTSPLARQRYAPAPLSRAATCSERRQGHGGEKGKARRRKEGEERGGGGCGRGGRAA